MFCADMNPESPDYYMIGHCIDGRVLYPATGYLVLAWRTLMRSLGAVMEHTPVIFEDVTIYRATILPKTGKRFVFFDCSCKCKLLTIETLYALFLTLR